MRFSPYCVCNCMYVWRCLSRTLGVDCPLAEAGCSLPQLVYVRGTVQRDVIHKLRQGIMSVLACTVWYCLSCLSTCFTGTWRGPLRRRPVGLFHLQLVHLAPCLQVLLYDSATYPIPCSSASCCSV